MAIQLTELHYRNEPNFDYAAIKTRIEELVGSSVNTPKPEEVENAFVVFHTEYTIQYSDAQVPAQTALLAADGPAPWESYQGDIQQSWNCPNAEELLRGTTHPRLVTEMMARGLEPRDRVVLFHAVLQAVVEQSRPHALVFKHSQQVVAPDAYLAACTEEPILRPGSVNARLFNISNTDDEMIMDTRGLEEIGLHDLQCHFRHLDPKNVAQVLYNTAFYIFEHGRVIASGQTVAGTHPESKWQCQFEMSLLEPKRELLDLNPGEPYAGTR